MECGGVWIRETKEGKKYMSMSIEYPGFKNNFAIFKNDNKEKDNQPDYKVVWSPPKKEGYSGNSGGGGNDDGNGFPV